jgi:hypothetical protein
MTPLRRFFQKATVLFRRPQGVHRLALEIEDHLARKTANNICAGLSPDEAAQRHSQSSVASNSLAAVQE